MTLLVRPSKLYLSTWNRHLNVGEQYVHNLNFLT